MLNGLKEVVKVDEQTYTAHTVCPSCRTASQFPIKKAEYCAYIHDGALIQRAFKSLDATHREMLQSGTCQPCWDRVFKTEEED